MSLHLAPLLAGLAGLAGLASPVAPQEAKPDAYLLELAEEAERLEPLIETDAVLELLAAVPRLEPVDPPWVMYSRPGKGYLSDAFTADERAAMDREARRELRPMPVDTRRFYTTFYGSPLAALRPLDLAAARAFESYEGKRVLDFGFGSVGQLRLLAHAGAEAVGTEVMPLLRVMYGDAAGDGVTLVFDRWPATEAAREAVGGGFDLFVSKNTLKKGFLHPRVAVDPKLLMDLGVPDGAFLDAVHACLKPGGLALIYNLGTTPAEDDADYHPSTDIACPWPAAILERHGFEVLAHDADDSEPARELGRVLQWETGPRPMDLENGLFARYTLLRRPR